MEKRRKTILGSDIGAGKYYYGEVMYDPKFEISEEEYDEYRKEVEDETFINFKKIDLLQAQLQYIEGVYKTIESEVDTYTESEHGAVYYHIASDYSFSKIIFRPTASFFEIEGEEEYITTYYCDSRDGKNDWRVLTVVENTKTGEVYKYYKYNKRLIRYVHSDGKVYDYNGSECYVDTTTIAYGLQENGFWE